jgi:hypothetical protein
MTNLNDASLHRGLLQLLSIVVVEKQFLGLPALFGRKKQIFSGRENVLPDRAIQLMDIKTSTKG